MNQIGRIKLALSMIALLAMSSCIKEDPDDCKIRVSFDYSYNILSSNALENQVDQLMLYVFDGNGMLVSIHSRQGGAISNALTVEMNKPEASGRYRFVAWGKSNTLTGDEANFVIPDLTVGVSRLEDLNYYLKRELNFSQYELNNFLVGAAEADVQNTPGTDQVKISLKKVNKKIRVVLLPYLGNTELDVNDYLFSITDPIGSGHIKYDYSMLADEPTTYLPYYKSNIHPSSNAAVPSGEVDKAVAVEFSTSRLIETNVPRLHIITADGSKELVNINLPWLFSLTEMESHRIWSLQEYLDRQDEYVITLFFDNDKWMDVTIIINGWVVNNVNINP